MTDIHQKLKVIRDLATSCPGHFWEETVAMIRDEAEAALAAPVPETTGIKLPEEWKTCKSCGLGDVEIVQQCSNSDCKQYAGEVSLYRGWDAAPVPDCGACPGDGSVCSGSCRLSTDSPDKPQWVSLHDRWPTEDDADFTGRVWFWDGQFDCPSLSALNDRGPEYTYWMPTGLQRPEAPGDE